MFKIHVYSIYRTKAGKKQISVDQTFKVSRSVRWHKFKIIQLLFYIKYELLCILFKTSTGDSFDSSIEFYDLCTGKRRWGESDLRHVPGLYCRLVLVLAASIYTIKCHHICLWRHYSTGHGNSLQLTVLFLPSVAFRWPCYRLAHQQRCLMRDVPKQTEDSAEYWPLPLRCGSAKTAR